MFRGLDHFGSSRSSNDTTQCKSIVSRVQHGTCSSAHLPRPFQHVDEFGVKLAVRWKGVEDEMPDASYVVPNKSEKKQKT